MNARERVLKAINHEELDRVPTFCQVVMPGFKKKILEYWGDDYKKERKYVFYVKDYKGYYHFIWHVFVFAGSISHFFAVLWYS